MAGISWRGGIAFTGGASVGSGVFIASSSLVIASAAQLIVTVSTWCLVARLSRPSSRTISADRGAVPSDLQLGSSTPRQGTSWVGGLRMVFPLLAIGILTGSILGASVVISGGPVLEAVLAYSVGGSLGTVAAAILTIRPGADLSRDSSKDDPCVFPEGAVSPRCLE